MTEVRVLTSNKQTNYYFSLSRQFLPLSSVYLGSQTDLVFSPTALLLPARSRLSLAEVLVGDTCGWLIIRSFGLGRDYVPSHNGPCGKFERRGDSRHDGTRQLL